MNSKFTTKITISKKDFDIIEKVFYNYLANNNYEKEVNKTFNNILDQLINK
jgi:hypothetical protein